MIYLKKVENEFIEEQKNVNKKLKTMEKYRFSIIEFYTKKCMKLIKTIKKTFLTGSIILGIIGIALIGFIFIFAMCYPLFTLMEYEVSIIIGLLYVTKRLFFGSKIKTLKANEQNLNNRYKAVKNLDNFIELVKQKLNNFEYFCNELEYEEGIKYKENYESELLNLIDYLNNNWYSISMEELEKLKGDLNELEKKLCEENRLILDKINEKNINLITNKSNEIDKKWMNSKEPIAKYITKENNAITQLTLLKTLQDDIFNYFKSKNLLGLYSEVKFNKLDNLEIIYRKESRVRNNDIDQFVESYDQYWESLNKLLKEKEEYEENYAKMDQIQKINEQRSLSLNEQIEAILLTSEKNHKENMNFNKLAYKKMLKVQNSIVNSVNSLGSQIESVESKFTNLFDNQAREIKKVRENLDYDIKNNRNGSLKHYN